MKHFFSKRIFYLSAALTCAVFFYSPLRYHKTIESTFEENGGLSKKDMMDKAWEFEFEITKDPALNTVPRERLLSALAYTRQLEADQSQRSAIPNFNWTERGPNNWGGRTRSIMVDPNDPTQKRVFGGSVGGGLWRNEDITSSYSSWTPVNDFFADIAVTSLTYNPLNTQEMYFGTGEGYSNADAARGLGIWKSTDGGNNWNQLASTNNSNFYYVNRLVVNQITGDVYAATNSGLFRSQDVGSTWTKVLGFGVGAGTNNFSDVEVSSTGVIWASTRTNGEIYNSSSGNINAWTRLNSSGTNGMPSSGISRIDFALAPSNAQVCYAYCAVAGVDFYKTTNGGASWTLLPKPVDADGGIGNDITRSQYWYDMSIAVDPNNENTVWVGGVDLFRSVNGGASWQQMSHWYGGYGFQDVHADQHIAIYQPGNSNIIYFGNDGGIWRSANATATMPGITSRNTGYDVTQFYACAINPTAYSNQFLAGAQDNGSHGFSSPGINSTIEVTGGDGCFCHIDQNQPNYQFTSYVYNNYYRSTNTGQSFSSVSFGTTGSFVNPTDYDDNANIMYAAISAGNYLRWNNPQTGNATATISIAAFGTGTVRAVTVSPNTANRVFFGLNTGSIVIVDNANGAAPTGVDIKSTSMPTASVSCIAVQNGNDNHLLATYSNYGVNSIWETTNALSAAPAWTSVEGNVPDMPVRWAIFNPNNSQQAVIATELGVWSTDFLNGTSTNWAPSNTGLANVRVTQLQMRTSDNFLIASTHGRGLFSSDVFTAPYVDFMAVSTIVYINQPVKFTDGSYQAQTWNWDFGDATNSNVKNPTHSYTTPGLKTVVLTINGALSATRTNYIQVLPDLGTPYAPSNGGDFESNILHFGADTKFGTGWQRGNSAVTNKSGTVSPNNAWVTGLNANYVSNSYAILYAPDFNFTSPGTYTVRFYTKHKFETGWDGYRVEYSLDRGTSWNILGTVTANWYDFANTTQTTAFPLGEPFFNAQASSFTLKSYDASFLAGNATVAFRFVFRSDASVNDAGAAIDNFEIQGPSNNPLPVELLLFTGTAFGSYNELYWTTASEINNSGFYVQRSVNGRDFTDIGFEDGAGNTNETKNYSFGDNNVSADLYYYRLRQVDFDGAEHLSPVIAIAKTSGKPLTNAAVSPNPFVNTLNIDFSRPLSGELSVRLLSAGGKEIVTENRLLKNSSGLTLNVDEHAVPSGIYFVQLITGKENKILKIVKE